MDYRKIKIKFVFWLGLIATIVTISGITIKDLIFSKNVESFSTTVFVHGDKGKDDVLLKNGEVVMNLGTTKIEASINDKGEATFKELPLGYVGEKVLISINHKQPYYPVNRGFEYVLKKNEPIYLEIELKGLEEVYGRVLDFKTENPIENVRVSYKGFETFTDIYGWYNLKIPKSYQAKYIRLNFYKKGYIIQDVDNIAPHTKQETGILLKPIE
tara:strand:+ start:134 stop:775 length:642 start_codon:yes stop_codon:yes gene_type:complete